MEEVSSLARKLKHHLPLHQARITFIAHFIVALIRSRSTNLYRVAEEFQTTADSESSYRRIKRFFADYEYSYEQPGQLILACLEIDRFTLCMDRSNWKHGSKDVNYLVISYDGETLFPLSRSALIRTTATLIARSGLLS